MGNLFACVPKLCYALSFHLRAAGDLSQKSEGEKIRRSNLPKIEDRSTFKWMTKLAQIPG